MNSSVIISIVIAVYNGEAQIDRVVNSILPQLNEKLELILVDDGSTDHSAAICDLYAEKYKSIHVIHKKNGGVTAARNSGIAAAQGEYLSFIDVDDYVSDETYEKIVSVIMAYHPDLIDFGWNYVSQLGEITHNHHGLSKDTLLGLEDIKDSILPPLLNLESNSQNFIFDFTCNKVFKSEIIRNNNIQFDELRRTWEDRPFLVEYLKYCNNFYSIDQYFYNYVFTQGSLSQKWDDQYFSIIVENFKLYSSLYKDWYNFDTEYVNQYWSQAIENMIFRALQQASDKSANQQMILNILSDEYVVHWFSNRVPRSSFEKRVTNYICSQQYQAAFNCFERKHRTDFVYNRFNNVVRTMRSFMRKLLE